jgi:predicted NACHT family NTPase
MFPSNFLTDLARKYELSPEQEEVFLLWWVNGKNDREISEQLHVTVEAIRNRKTGIYKKFSIAGVGANKANKLRNWLETETKKQNVKADLQPDDNLDLLVQDVKQKIAADVRERCGTMRVLDMTQPVDLDRIYTDVNIIKDVTGRRRIGYDEVMEVCTREHFDRFLVGTIKERVKGFEAVEEFQKLVVLGKPGAGKTTFMKYLAMSCLDGRFRRELVPIFVTLKAYAEEREQPSLENYILTEFQNREVSGEVVKRLLKEGRALILLDGLDEVKKEDDRRVKQDIDRFSRDWLKNRFAITCRIAAREYQFEKFTEVEVADFDDDQIESFVDRWFREKDQSKVVRLLERLKDNQPVKELAQNPLLLTLLCLVFGELNDFPLKRSELYKECLAVLMKKWDAKRNIERETIYKNLSSLNKEDMLGQIAFNTFVNGEYFFRQEDLQRQIKDYICNLPEASADPEVLRLDSEVVLKAIEHHHGLLVERARNIYSFSHLTFQEYFTANEIVRKHNFDTLMQNIFDPRWKEVFLLTAELRRESNDFLKMMKDRIDKFVADDERLQAFLEWADGKTDLVRFSCKKVVVRAFYAFVEARVRDRTIDRDRDISFNYARANAKELAMSIDPKSIQNLESLEPNLFIDYCLALDRPITLNPDPNQIDEREIAHERSLDLDTQDIELQPAKDRLEKIVQNLNNAIKIAPQIGGNKLQQALQVLISRLPNVRKEEAISQWWKNSRKQWMDEFYEFRIDRRKIGQDWQFTKEQVELLNQYYAANLLLVECMNRSYVSKQVREEIESTMLLPSKK